MAGRSSCPECGTILRIRDSSFVGRRVSCPECKTTLRIAAGDADGDFLVHRLTPSELNKMKSSSRETDTKNEIPKKSASTRSPFARIFYSPLTAAWLLAIAVSAFIAVLTLTPKIRLAQARPAVVRQVPAQESKVQPEPIIEIPVVADNKSPEDRKPVADSAINVIDLDVDSPLMPVVVEVPALADVVEEKKVIPPSPPQKKDIPSMMSVKITGYNQRKVRRRDLIDTLQEALGADIRYDAEELGAAKLDETTAFELTKTSIGEIIKAVADDAGWEIVIEDMGILLRTKQPIPAP